jgi:hypothetical protein
VRFIVLVPSRPSIGVERKDEGKDPGAFKSDSNASTEPVGNARWSTTPAPQSKPVAHASRLVARGAPSVAFGLGLRILAAGPARIRLYSDRGRLCDPDAKVFWTVEHSANRIIPSAKVGNMLTLLVRSVSP